MLAIARKGGFSLKNDLNPLRLDSAVLRSLPVRPASGSRGPYMGRSPYPCLAAIAFFKVCTFMAIFLVLSNRCADGPLFAAFGS